MENSNLNPGVYMKTVEMYIVSVLAEAFGLEVDFVRAICLEEASIEEVFIAHESKYGHRLYKASAPWMVLIGDLSQYVSTIKY